MSSGSRRGLGEGRMARLARWARCRPMVGGQERLSAGLGRKEFHVPMHKHGATSIEGLLDEAVGGRKVLEQVLVVDVVDLDDHVLEGAEEGVVERHAQDGQDVGDVGLLQGISAAQGEDALEGQRA